MAICGSYEYKFPQPSEYREEQRLATTECSLLLASSSKSRRTLFSSACIPFGTFSAPLDEDDVQDWLETRFPNLLTDKRTLLIAQLKANAAVSALRGQNSRHLQHLRLQNQVLNLPECERLHILQDAERTARANGRATAAVAQLATFTESCAALEAADGRIPILIAVDTGVELNGHVMFKPKDKEEADTFLKSYSNSDSPVNVITSVVMVDLCNELENPPWDPNAVVPATEKYPYKCRNCSKPQRLEQNTKRDDSCSCPLTVVHAADILDGPGGPKMYRSSSREAFTVYTELKYGEMNEEVRRRIIEQGDVMYSAGALIFEEGEMAKYLKSIKGCGHNVVGFPMNKLHESITRLLRKAKSQ